MNEIVTPAHIRFSTDDLPERQRFPAFCDGMFHNIVGADIEQTGPGVFSGALDIRFAGPVVVANIAVTPTRISRQAHHVRDGVDSVVLLLWRSGSAGLVQQHNAQRIETGDALIIDNAKPAVLSPDTQARFWALTIPRHALMTAARETMDVRGGIIANGASCRLLLGYLKETLSEEFGDGRSSRLLGNHFVDLAALALAPHAGFLPDNEGISAARRVAILREIDRQCSNPAVNAITVAAQLGITPRYVHLLLEDTGKSFTHHVLERRLKAAFARLRDPQWRWRKIADIAAEAGFADLSYFNRTFRRRFGATPSDIRESVNGSLDHRA